MPGARGVRVAGVEFVRAHHPADDVPVAVAIVGGGAGEEPGDLEDHLGALQREEFAVAGGLVVLPDVAGDRDADVALQVGRVRQPAARLRVEVQQGALLPCRRCRTAMGTWRPRDRPRAPLAARRAGDGSGRPSGTGSARVAAGSGPGTRTCRPRRHARGRPRRAGRARERRRRGPCCWARPSAAGGRCAAGAPAATGRPRCRAVRRGSVPTGAPTRARAGGASRRTSPRFPASRPRTRAASEVAWSREVAMATVFSTVTSSAAATSITISWPIRPGSLDHRRLLRPRARRCGTRGSGRPRRSGCATGWSPRRAARPRRRGCASRSGAR